MGRFGRKWGQSICRVCNEFFDRVSAKKDLCPDCKAKTGICVICGESMPLYSLKSAEPRLTCSQTCHNRRISSDPEIQERISQTITRVMKDIIHTPEYKVAWLAGMRRNVWIDEVNERRGNALSEYAKTPEAQEQYSKLLTERWATDGYKESQSERMKLQWENDEWRDSQIDTLKQAQQRPEEKARKSADVKARWARGDMDGVVKISLKSGTKIELLIRDEFIRIGITDFVMTYRLGRYKLDFGFPELKLDVECDGAYWHALHINAERDIRRDAYCESIGWTVIRLGEQEIMQDASRVVVEKVLPTLLALYDKKSD